MMMVALLLVLLCKQDVNSILQSRYLKKILSGLVADIINNPVSLEVDPAKLKGEDLDTNKTWQEL
jgi:hypothetical protein